MIHDVDQNEDKNICFFVYFPFPKIVQSIDIMDNCSEIVYRIRVNAAPLLNRAPGNVESPVFGVFIE